MCDDIELGDFAVTPVTPNKFEETIVWDIFECEGIKFFVLIYRAQDEPTFVVRQRGQITEIRHAP